jgi:hypothetical protein
MLMQASAQARSSWPKRTQDISSITETAYVLCTGDPAYVLCTGDPAVLTGRIVETQPFLREFGRLNLVLFTRPICRR